MEQISKDVEDAFRLVTGVVFINSVFVLAIPLYLVLSDTNEGEIIQ